MILFATLVVALLAGAEACPPSFTFINGHCFSFQSQVVLPWAEAQEFCGNMSTTLAVVRSPTTLRGIYEYIMTYGLDGSYWLDASDIMYEGDWVWSDDSRVERGTPFWAIRHGLFGSYLSSLWYTVHQSLGRYLSYLYSTTHWLSTFVQFSLLELSPSSSNIV
ncbi:perlucin-like [Panulirus ornatus]|uniref:perlucin-like n=1 Tax=Panulirus ornatus TaxID=150431 RepID=UPI003A86156E